MTAAASTGRKIVPTHMAHIVLKTKQYEAMVDWYRTVFHAEPVYADPMLTFLTFDDEHHRIVLGNWPPSAPDLDPASVGMAHFAWSYASIEDLVSTYERLKAAGIVPFWPNNHGVTTSLYYRDPDGNEVELQANNFATAEECKAYFKSPEYCANPIGNSFDVELFVRGYRAGRPFGEIMQEAVEAARVAAG